MILNHDCRVTCDLGTTGTGGITTDILDLKAGGSNTEIRPLFVALVKEPVAANAAQTAMIEMLTADTAAGIPSGNVVGRALCPAGVFAAKGTIAKIPYPLEGMKRYVAFRVTPSDTLTTGVTLEIIETADVAFGM